MAHGAVILVLLARFRQSFRRGRDWVFLCGILRRHLGFRGGGFILSEVWFGAENSEQQHCTCDEDCPAHSILPTGREPPKERTRLDFERILRPREVEGKGYNRTKPGWELTSSVTRLPFCLRLWQLFFRFFPWAGHRATALWLRVAKTRTETAGFAHARPHPIDYRRNRGMCHSTNEENHQRGLARRIGARSDSESLHAGLFHPFIHMCGMNRFRLRHECFGNAAHGKCIAVRCKWCAFAFLKNASRRVCFSPHNSCANTVENRGQFHSRLSRIDD